MFYCSVVNVLVSSFVTAQLFYQSSFHLSRTFLSFFRTVSGPSRRFRSNSDSLSNAFLFVKHFFKDLFQRSFSEVSECSAWPPVQSNPLDMRVPGLSAGVSVLYCAFLLRDSLFMIAQGPPPVNTLFYIFYTIFYTVFTS